MKVNPIDIPFEKIVVHDGEFHADEVLAVAMLQMYFLNLNVGMPSYIVRTRDLSKYEGAGAEQAIIIDVGMEHDPDRLRFDHHQYRYGKSACMLIWDWLNNQEILLIEDEEHRALIEKYFLNAVSAFDTGEMNAYRRWNTMNNELGLMFTNFSELVSMYNLEDKYSNPLKQRNRFYEAVKFAIDTLENVMSYTSQIMYSQMLLSTAETDSMYIAYHPLLLIVKIVFLKDELSFTNKLNFKCQYFVEPNKQGWSITSIHSEKFPIPEEWETKGVVFSHAHRFFTVYESLEVLKESITGLQKIKS